MRRDSKPDWQKQIARERIEILFRQASLEFPAHPERSDRYIEIARNIGKRYRVKIPQPLKRSFCKHCYRYIRVGANARVRLSPSKSAKVVTCLNCGKQTRYRYK